MTDKPVVVYGASGYTGRLICEYLREYNVPFVAAGRDEGRLRTRWSPTSPASRPPTTRSSGRPRRRLADRPVRRRLGRLNTVGPFSQLGPAVVEAGLAAGVHYLDTTGEQDWLITCDEQYGADFAAAGLLLAPGVAQMYTTGEIAAEVALEQPGLDTLDIAVFWGGSPTVASTLTILVNAARSAAYYLEQNAYAPWDPEPGLYQLAIPGQHELALALPWGGTSHPVWFKRDPRVANVKVLGGVFNAALMQGVPQIVAAAVEATKDMEPDEKYAALTATAPQVMSPMPPRENPRVNKSLDSVHASGPLGRAHVVIHGNQNYKQTGRSRPTPRTPCCSSRPGGSASRRAARRSGTASCSGCCAASAWSPSRSSR